MRIAAIAVAVWVATVWFCGFVYVVVSYTAAASHVPARRAGAVAKSMLREMWLVMWTQPIAPLFQVVLGVRMGSGGGDVPVVLVHGYFQNRVDFLFLARRLRASGSGPLFACNFFWPQALEKSSATVQRFVEWVCAETGAAQVDMVTHSAGGLFALDVIDREPDLVRRAVLIAVPAGGVPWRGPLVGTSGDQLRASSARTPARTGANRVPTLSIFSAHDNVVHPTTTSRLEGAMVTNVRVDGAGHLSVLFDPDVADRVCAFLADDRPDGEEPAGAEEV